ncbi:metallophosphoesterase [Candidatus Pacearchaeota archaeon]|jgi:DNA repair exonuclease SbcCD nuclease subunit|nr:metallophosphoesterase [Candidatus Pacearchaeota archaeon]
MKCLILGDVHLGKSTAIGKSAELGQLNSRVQDQIDLLDWAYNQCIATGTKLIAITGDVYQDFRPHPAVIGIFMRWLKKCEHDGIIVHVVMGNHDIMRSGNFIFSALDLVADLEMASAKVHKLFNRLEAEDFTFVFIPFRDKRMYDVKTKEEALTALQAELAKVIEEPSSKIKVAIGHLAFEGSIAVGDEIGDTMNELFIPPEMLEWFDFVWMGHIHHPQIIQHSKPYAAHIGSLDRSDFSRSEVENEKIAILLDSNHKDKFTEIVLPTRPLRPVKIEVPVGKDSTEFVINELCLLSKKLEFKGAIVRVDVQLNGAELENVDQEKAKSYILNNLEAYHICGFSEIRAVSVIQIDPEDVFDNTMEISQSINKWADTRDVFENDLEREEFKVAAHEIRMEYEGKFL